MKITLISNDNFSKLLEIYNNNPILTLQNKGYEEIGLRNELTDTDKEQIKEVSTILREAIFGFSRFQNFRLNKDNEIQLRFQYNWEIEGGVPFVGVGYILLDELLNGFR